MKHFADRREAGRELAKKLRAYRGKAVVFALPRGGVETGVEVARLLGVPLGVVISRKLGHPTEPEYAVCAVTETGPLVCDELELASLDLPWLEQAESAERAEAKRRRETYLAERPHVPVKDKIVIVVDDGIATGLTMRAAVAELLRQHPKKLIVAVPAAPRDAMNDLLEMADEVVALADPDAYVGAVGAYYDSFPQLTDEDVMILLDEADQTN